jgi:dynein heavy chain
VSQIYWTIAIEEAINRDQYRGVSDVLVKCKDQLNDLTDLVRGNLTNLERLTLGALITLDVHSRDTTSKLIDNQIQAITDFDWISQFRYYWYEICCVGFWVF